ncbi:MAG: prolyl oligopeptidase family serine peptidase [Candidatus Dadabacteria bacterium]
MKNFLFVTLLLVLTLISAGQTTPISPSESEIIYGRKDGLAMTMVKHTPDVASNHRAIVWVVSGSWYSSYNQRPGSQKLKQLMDRGYTVFEVIHGSQPKYNIEDAIADLQRAVRYIRYNASTFGIDPAHIGVSGASAGGHLSLLVGLEDGTGNAASTDPINRESAKVQAVAVFFPPTDFTMWGGIKDPFSIPGLLKANNVVGAFDFKTWDSSSRVYTSIKDPKLVAEHAKNVSPAYYVTNDDPPVFIYHGDKDHVVPLSQSQELVQKLREVKVPVEIKIKPGGDHGWPGQWQELNLFADWFDKYLR